METKLALNIVPNTSGLTPAPAPPSPQPEAHVMQDDPADLRLIIEPDPGTGGYIYKTIDRRTGAVVLQLPREDVVRMQASQDYRTGAVVKAKV